MDGNLVSSIFKILNCFFLEYIATEIKKVEPEDIDHLFSILESLWTFAITWSLCCTVNRFGREIFNNYVRDRIK